MSPAFSFRVAVVVVTLSSPQSNGHDRSNPCPPLLQNSPKGYFLPKDPTVMLYLYGYWRLFVIVFGFFHHLYLLAPPTDSPKQYLYVPSFVGQLRVFRRKPDSFLSLDRTLRTCLSPTLSRPAITCVSCSIFQDPMNLLFFQDGAFFLLIPVRILRCGFLLPSKSLRVLQGEILPAEEILSNCSSPCRLPSPCGEHFDHYTSFFIFITPVCLMRAIANSLEG